MDFGDSELIYENHGVRLIKVGCRNGKEVYWGNGSTQHFTIMMMN